ncbi:MAG: NAD(P)/FAD-dependent oxidoreductase [Bacteroidia bacterium]
MISVDAIIVGQGLAGSILAEEFSKNNTSFIIIDSGKNVSSHVAAGLWNPIVFKRITKSWRADELIPQLYETYQNIEKKYTISILENIDVVKLFNSFEEQNDWHAKAQEDDYKNYLSTEKKVAFNEDNFKPHHGYGIVKKAGRVNLSLMLSTMSEYWKNKQQLLQEAFDFSALKMDENSVHYKNISAQKIIFCEGVHVRQNPFFSYVPISLTKGEILHATIQNLHMDFVLNKGFFVYPSAKEKFVIGATYHWQDESLEPTKQGEEELLEKYHSTLNLPIQNYTISAGFRPTTKDRRPVLGTHPEIKNMFIFNGLGTKGVMIAPYFAKHFVEHLYNHTPLDKEVSIERFKHLYHDKKN